MNNGVKAELSATTRTAAGRFTYPAGVHSMLVRTSAGLVGSSDASVTIDPATRTVSGSVTSGNFCGNKNLDGNPDRTSYYTLHFVARFDADFTAYGTWKDGAVTAGSTGASGGTSYAGGSSGGITAPGGLPKPGKGSGAYLQFGAQSVGVRVGVSYVDAAGAQANLDAEQPAGTSFDSVAAAAHDAWNAKLNAIEVQGGTAAQQKTFYTALYHSLLHMNVYSDVDGRYRGMDQQTHTLAAGQYAQYATFSGWDVYRSQVQLVSLLDPTVAGDMAQSLLNQSTQDADGRWDRWTHNSGAVSVMSGDPSPAFVDTVAAFGGTNWDRTAALRSLVRAATIPTAADLSHIGWMNTAKGQRPSLDKFLQLHYFPEPSNAWSGASETLEDASADFAIADLAARLGDGATREQFMQRAQYWQNIFHLTGAGFMQNRAADGTWPAFDPAGGPDFAEGSPAQYVWNIPFNVAGLFAAMGRGGCRGFAARRVLPQRERVGVHQRRRPASGAQQRAVAVGAVAVRVGREARQDAGGRAPDPRHAVDDDHARHPRQRRPRDDVVLVRVRRDGDVPGDPRPGGDGADGAAVLEGRHPPGERADADGPDLGVRTVCQLVEVRRR